MPFQPTIIIPTKDRREILPHLLDSIRQLTAIDRIVPEIIVADQYRPDVEQSENCNCLI